MKTTLTPMMKQYMDIKDKAKDALLFYRLGDFYECFFEDAHIVARLCDLILTSRSKDDVDKIEYGEVVITFGNQLKGFEYPNYKTCVISDREVFGEAKRKAQGFPAGFSAPR